MMFTQHFLSGNSEALSPWASQEGYLKLTEATCLRSVSNVMARARAGQHNSRPWLLDTRLTVISQMRKLEHRAQSSADFVKAVAVGVGV